MREWQSQSHVRWYCSYHVVWVPKWSDLRRDARGVGRIVQLCQRHGVELVEGQRCRITCMSCWEFHRECGEPVGFLKGKSDPHSSGVSGAAAQLPLLGYCVSTVQHPRTRSRREETGETGASRRPLRGASSYRPLGGGTWWDINGAASAGLTTFWIQRTAGEPPEELGFPADRVVQAITDLAPVV